MPKRADPKKKTTSKKQDVMLFLKNLQDRLDRVEIALEKIQLGTDKEQVEDEQKIVIADSIVDEQITEAVAGLREDLNDLLGLIFSPKSDMSYLDSQTQDTISELRNKLEKFKSEVKTEVIQEIKRELPEKPPTLKAEAPKKAKATKKGSPKKIRRKKK